MITKVFIEENQKKYYLSDGINNSLNDLNQLNIFIGANNTGKSRFLRNLFSEQNFKLEISEFDSKSVSEIFSLITKDLNEYLENIGFDDIGSQNIPSLKNELNKQITNLNQIRIKNHEIIVNDAIQFWNWFKDFNTTSGSHKTNFILGGRIDKANFVIKRILNKYKILLDDLIPESFEFSIERLYIPILRGLRPTQFIKDNNFDEIQDNYLKRTIRDYFLNNPNISEEIFTGLRLYNDTKKMLLGKREEREKIKDFESFLSKTFFNNQPFTLIPNIEDDSLHVSIGEEERPIYMLGDGIQSIIILLYPLFFNQGKKMMVFIEEPENSMHPGLQRLFIETLMQSKFENFQYFITTHSNHFLDLTLDLSKISVYTFKKKVESEGNNLNLIENTSNAQSSILDLLGVRNSSVFLSNCTIWVEGITDRLYIKKYLEIYQNYLQQTEGKSPYREDFNYSFIEYGGSNITHWDFGEGTKWEKIKASRISSKIFLISDKDSTEKKPNSEKAKRLQILSNLLGDNFQTIDGYEVENILSPKILIKSIKTLESNNNHKIVYNENKIIIENYKNMRLGDFIEKSFKNLTRKYKADSGTIFCKIDFCKAAISNIENYDDLSTEAKNLIFKIYNFIKSTNSQ